MRFDARGRLSASALAYAVLISLVLTLITLALMMAFQLHSSRIADITDMHRSVRNAESGLLLLLSDPTVASTSVLHKDLYGDRADSVRLERRTWGAFQVLRSTATCGIQTADLMVLAGSMVNDSVPSLILADKGKPLSLCGETRISGDCLLPKSGVKRAYIEGKNYVGRELIYGRQLQSPSSIGQVQVPDFSDHISSNLETIDFEDLDVLTVERSFSTPSLLIGSSEPMLLNGVNWSGNILVRSDTEIIIGWNSHLSRCMVSAPKVTIESGFEGDLQVYGDSVIVEPNVRLDYPSGIYISEIKNAVVSIGEDCTVLGQILVSSMEAPLVSIGSNSGIYGEVVNPGITELKGKVYGQLQTGGFVLRTPSATYENHLLDVVIGMEHLPRPFVSYIRANGNLSQITRLQ
ncbi:MAG: hypothetical protein GC178_01780 [Flavobacteriales bacterium]|nr:hypothetical protein [Flavobacteriales bacterium]